MGLVPGAEFSVRETPQGFVLRPSDPPLSKVYVEPTTACNLNCRTCMRNSWEEPLGTMEMATYKRLLNGLRGVPSLDTVAFWGFGEPLLHPGIVEMITLAGQTGAKTELITNGLLLNREMAGGLVGAGLDTLVVSVDGTSPESHADIRSGVDLRAVRENVKTLLSVARSRSRQSPEIGLEFVVTRRNISELPELRRLARTMEASFIVLTNVLPYTEELNEEVLYCLSTTTWSPQVRSEWTPEIVLPRMDMHREFLGPLVGLLRHGGTLDPLPGSSDGKEGYCRFVERGSVAIAWNGEVSPCVALMHSYRCYVLGREKQIRRYTVGNVGRKEMMGIWGDREYREFRKKVLQFHFAPCAYCGGCELAETNEEDCFGNTFPVCGDCLWARGIILCP